MTNGINNATLRCDICKVVLLDGEKDIRELSKPYEIPYDIQWSGTDCSLTNKVVRHICQHCTEKIIGTMKELMILGE